MVTIKGMASLPAGVTRLPSGRFRARVKLAGHDESATFSTVARAVRWREDTRDALLTGGTPPRPAAPPEPVAVSATVLDVIRAMGAGINAGTVRTKSGGLYRPSVSRRMESLLRVHVVPRIGAIPAASLTRREVQQMVDQLAASASPETARKAVRALAVAMRVAERDGTIERSPCRDIRTPQDGEGERPPRFLTHEEADAILDAAAAEDADRERSFSFPLVYLALATGLRLGELLALRWGPWGDDEAGVDLGTGVVRVRWNLDRLRDKETGEFRMVRPKSRAGWRDVPLAADDVAVMRRHLLATGRPAAGALVWADDGAPWCATGEPHRAWQRVRAAARVDGLDDDGEPTRAALAGPLPRFHDLRHTWCVFMLRAGVRPEAVAKLGGWSDVGIIHRRYGKHALPDELAGAGEALAAYRASLRDASGTT